MGHDHGSRAGTSEASARAFSRTRPAVRGSSTSRTLLRARLSLRLAPTSTGSNVRQRRRSFPRANGSAAPARYSLQARLAKRRRLREGDLAGETILLLTEGHCLREQALAACQARGADDIGDFRATSLSTLVEMVRGGEGVTLLPELTVPIEARRRDLALVPLEPLAPFRTIGLAWRAASGRAAEYALLGESLTPGPRRSGGQVAATIAPIRRRAE